MTNTVCEQLNNYGAFWIKIGLIGGIWFVSLVVVSIVFHASCNIIEKIGEWFNKGEK